MNTRSPVTGGGLQVPQGLGASQSEINQIVERFATQSVVEADLQQRGIHDPIMPSEALPTVTAELLTTTDSKQYTSMYAKQLAWFNYVTPMLALAKSSLLQAENTLDLIQAKIKEKLYEENRLLDKKDKLTADELRNKLLNHPSYQDALLDVQRMTQYKYRLEGMAEIAERNMAVISRQVEIRKIDMEGHQRENNMPRSGYIPRPVR